MLVAAYIFADRYRAASLAPNGEIIRHRQESIENIRKEIDTERVVELTRLYFGLTPKESPDWFIEAFSETDPTFSMLDNEREVAVLSECLLAAVLEDGVTAAGLAVLSASANGNRQLLLERSKLVSDASNALMGLSVAGRQFGENNLKTITLPAKSAIGGSVDKFLQGPPDWNKTAELVREVSNENLEVIKKLTNQVNRELLPISQRLACLEEEVSMLWWYIGGWSRLLDRPFNELSPALAAGMAGIDLAGLTIKAPGPIASPAILHRLLISNRKGKVQEVSIQHMVDNFPSKQYDKLHLGAALKDVPDLCPALTGFRLAAEIGDSLAWKAAFRKVVGFDADTAFTPLELAMQVYREALLVSLLDR
jgi:hypothetical protein